MIHVIAIILLMRPAYANLHNKNFVLIGLFAVQCAIQPFFAIGDPNTNYLIIVLIGVFYAKYTLANECNKYWYWLTRFTLLSAYISLIECLLFNSGISNSHFSHAFIVDKYAIMAITIVQTMLIIIITNGYRREFRAFISNVKADWIRLYGLVFSKGGDDEAQS